MTSSGTYLPISLTHETLGGLIGARRPTVTLALHELADRGALIKYEDGWLLCEPPAQPSASHPAGYANGVRLHATAPSPWQPPAVTDVAGNGNPAYTDAVRNSEEARTRSFTLREEAGRLRRRSGMLMRGPGKAA